MNALNADLHCHSTASDGTLSPAEVVRRAHANGVDLLALTDHDELLGIADAAAEAADIGLRFVPGVEISVSWLDQTLHIVGLGVDPANQALISGLAQVRGGRDGRAMRIGDELARIGIHGAFEGALRYVGNPALVTRAHFARYLVEIGVGLNDPAVDLKFQGPSFGDRIAGTDDYIDEARQAIGRRCHTRHKRK